MLQGHRSPEAVEGWIEPHDKNMVHLMITIIAN